MNFPSTKRFSIIKDPNRRGIDGKPSRILEIMYKASETSIAEEFAHIWDIRGWEPENEGKWIFHRSDVCFTYEWWPSIYIHNTIEDLLNHLEETFHEQSANKPDNWKHFSSSEIGSGAKAKTEFINRIALPDYCVNQNALDTLDKMGQHSLAMT